MMILKRLLVPCVLLLTACSAHPGAGGWRETSNQAMFERLEIRYNGQADFYTRGQDSDAAWRCFWSAAGEFRVSMKCIDAGNENNEQEFVFLVEEQHKQGSLLQGGQTLGIYAWQPPTDPSGA